MPGCRTRCEETCRFRMGSARIQRFKGLQLDDCTQGVLNITKTYISAELSPLMAFKLHAYDWDSKCQQCVQ